jgi:hypothetical protein
MVQFCSKLQTTSSTTRSGNVQNRPAFFDFLFWMFPFRAEILHQAQHERTQLVVAAVAFSTNHQHTSTRTTLRVHLFLNLSNRISGVGRDPATCSALGGVCHLHSTLTV